MDIAFTGEKRYYRAHLEKIQELIKGSLLNDTILRGNSVRQLERKCCDLLGRRYAIAVNSGTDALLIALKSIGVGKGDEVIVPAFSFVASASVILSAGAVPVFVDVCGDSYLMDINCVEERITPKTKAIIAVNLFGRCLNYELLYEISTRYKIDIIEDASQSFGAKWSDAYSGSFGVASVFSFDHTKVLGGITTGGIIVTDDFNIFELSSKLRQHGFNPAYNDFEMLGMNSQMSSMNACIVNYNFDLELSRWSARKYIAASYSTLLANISGLILPRIESSEVSNHHKFVIRTDKRDSLKQYLLANCVETKIHYNRSLPEYSLFSNSIKPSNTIPPVAKLLSNEVLSLPIYPELEREEIEYICSVVQNFFANRNKAR